ncbi:MAG: acylneuraminate cytidylyltransferase family protein [Candidatus Lokiarchaeota archaeon]|nr:acylneuraminate cytidylyltransferase family protein [Candidatus Harpocratesius repetitus]
MANYAIIPARGGSKGVKRKNLFPILQKPLIKYTIDAALNSNLIDSIFVSTEDPNIKEYVKSFPIEIINRPDELAQDNSSTVDVIMDFLSQMQPKINNSDLLVLLQPTSPLRSTEDIDEAISKFLQQRSNEALISVCESEHSPYWSFTISENHLHPLFSLDYFKKPRQTLPQTYISNGAIYISSVQSFRKNQGFYSKKIMPYIMPRTRSVDIDSYEDIKYCEFLLKNTEYNKI